MACTTTSSRVPRLAVVLLAIIACLAFALGAGASVASAAAAAPKPEDDFFRADELGPTVALCGKEYYIPTVFGPTGMNGWVLNDSLVVREVEPGSPADGVVMPNDTIQAGEIVRGFAREKSIYGKNRLRDAMIEMAKRGQSVGAIVKAFVRDIQGPDDYWAQMAVDAIGKIGPSAKGGAGAEKELSRRLMFD